jgi:glutathione S-transferase
MKVETYLRMAGLPYEIVQDNLPFKAPKKKLPYIEDGEKRVGDSGFIIDYLKATYGDLVDGGLTPQDRATAHVLRRMLEESFYWSAVYSRWVEEEGWNTIRPLFFGHLPPLLRELIPVLARHSVRKSLWMQGTGRHSREEIYDIGKADLTALSVFLGDKPYLLGDKPTSIDAVAHAFVVNILVPPMDSPLKQHALTLPNFSAYCERMTGRYYGKS